MFRPMRRNRQQLSRERCEEILSRATSGVLAVAREYTTHFRSVIAFGQVRELTDEQEKRAAIEKLALRYAPQDSEDNRQRAIEQDWKPLCMLEMTVEHLSGKEAIELIREEASREE